MTELAVGAMVPLISGSRIRVKESISLNNRDFPRGSLSRWLFARFGYSRFCRKTADEFDCFKVAFG
jgi:hypothetical protein